MAFGRLWAGSVFGTNTGNAFAKFEGDDSALIGSLHHNDTGVGMVVYRTTGSFNGNRLSIEGVPETKIDGVQIGRLKATAVLQPTGSLEGEWETDAGSAGTFVLFPHDRSQVDNSSDSAPDQIHTARYNFGPVRIDREQIIALADDIQREFVKSKVIVTFSIGTEQSRYLEYFKRMDFNSDRADVVKLFVREPDNSGIDRLITIEFGQAMNWAMCQGASESWALGQLERLKRDVRQFERVYLARKFGIVGINQFMFVCTLVFLPSLANLRDRAILMGSVLALAFGVNWLHGHYLPHAAIYLGKKKDGWLTRALPSTASWLIGIAASVIAALIAAYLKGSLSLTSP